MQRFAATPRSFRPAHGLALAAGLRLSYPVSPRWALEAFQAVTDLQPGVRYRIPNSSSSSGVGIGALLQTGLAVRRLTLWQISPRLSLDAALMAAYAWLARPYQNNYLSSWGAQQPQPTFSHPVAEWRNQQRHRTAVVVGSEARVRYALDATHSLLLSLGYCQGLRTLVESRTQQLAYLNANGQVQQGGFVLRNRGSYATVQLGYGWQLGHPANRATTHTPRYGRMPASSATPEPEAPPVYFEPAEE
ncbi:hypothetical protein D0T11_06285 [Hymenobacter rubripertinctus]|uniref:Uncharacterized protein n=2 Tax=Hymenobacter rubripertinctus TaxID=2029981 RepID=A0A418R2X1_9BACT|nr:hypothetical protein D0T11_06285 [Hymenobacter rubripertinctus]